MINILVVDDEPKIRELIEQNLVFAGYGCVKAADGSEAIKKVEAGEIDLVLLDVMMPFTDGFTALKEIRARGFKIPIIMLTARGEEQDRVFGLEQGADDYIVKPFSPRELVARVKAVLSRTLTKEQNDGKSYIFGELVIDTPCHTVKISGKEIPLTPKEFDLLLYLANNKSIALSREKILQSVWNFDYFGEDRTVDTHIKMLRNHLGSYRDCIVTVWGVGYKFEALV